MKHAVCLGTVLLSVAFLSGCASVSRPARPAEDSAYCLASFNKVWDASVMALAEEHIPVDTLSKDKGVISTKFVNYSMGPKAHYELDAIAEKPSAARLAIWSQVGYTLSILITPVTDMGTQIKVTAHIEAYDKNISQEWHRCVSKKVIESRIVEKIKAQL
jgi:hypothetical protein